MTIKQYKKRYLKQLFEGEEKTADNSGDEVKGNSQNSNPAGNGDQSGADDKKYSDADLDRILNQKFEKWQKQQKKAVEDAQKNAQMSEAEKSNQRISDLEEQIRKLTSENQRGNNAKTARQVLSAEGISVPDSLVDYLIADDAEKTTANVKEFAKVWKAAIADGVKAALKGGNPPAGGGGAPTMTKEEIMKIKDTAERQKAIRANMHLFK